MSMFITESYIYDDVNHFKEFSFDGTYIICSVKELLTISFLLLLRLLINKFRNCDRMAINFSPVFVVIVKCH